jgi:hypothetical protein
MKKVLIIACIFIATSISSFAQGGSISGTVVDSETGEPLVGATVVHDASGKKVITDFDGNFSFSNVKVGINALSVSYISYSKTSLKRVSVEEGSATELSIKMTKEGSRVGNINYMALKAGTAKLT